MKKQITGLLSLVILFGSLSAQAQKEREKYEFVKEKSISKTYPASGNKLIIDNSFGHVKFIASDKNEIKVDVKIESSSNKEDHAQKVFEAISVTDAQQGNEIRFKTEIKNNKNNSDKDCKDCKSSMRIDYEVHLPVSVALSVSNSFGNTEIPDYKGSLAIVSKFGNLTAGNLENLKSITVEFGKAEIKKIANLDATFKFTSVDIANLSGKNNIHLEFCDKSRIVLDNTITSLSLQESYSTVNVKPSLNLSASYTITTQFGHFVDRTNAGIKRTDTPDKYGPDASKTFSGQSGNGNIKIDIKSNFGKIILGEATAEDLKEKEKGKDKNKSKSTAKVI